MSHSRLVATAARAIYWPFNTKPSQGRKLCMFILFLLVAYGAQAAAPLKKWTGDVNNKWSVAGNWSPAAVPVAGDSVQIPYDASLVFPVIEAGVFAKAKTVIVNTDAKLTIEAGAELELSGSPTSGGLGVGGEVYNNGTIKVKSGFQGINMSGYFLNKGTILLGETTSSPYAFKEEGIRVYGSEDVFVNDVTGVIVIYRAGNNGILLFQPGAQFTNHGKIRIREVGLNPVTAGTGDGIDARAGDFLNETTGDILVSRASANGLNCRAAGYQSTFTNKGKIVVRNSGLTTELELREGINNSSIFTNWSGAEISIDSAQNGGVFNQGVMSNYGQLSIGTLVPNSIKGVGMVDLTGFSNYAGGVLNIKNTGDLGILTGAFGVLTNQSNATITIDVTGDTGIESFGLGGINNFGSLKIGTTGAINGYGITSTSQIINQFGAELIIRNTSNIAINNVQRPSLKGFYADFKNGGTLYINTNNPGGPAIVNGDSCTFENLYCDSRITIASNHTISNTSIGFFTNKGQIIENASGNSSIRDNYGAVQNLGGGTFTVSGTNAGSVFANPGTFWTGCSNTNWANAQNWNTGIVPTAADEAIIPIASNNPVVLGGTAAGSKSVVVLPGATLTINATGSLTINGAASRGLLNQGTVQHYGRLNIGSTSSVGNHCLQNEGAFYNNTGGEVNLDRAILSGLWNRSGTFTNAAKITIGAVARVGSYGIHNEAAFQNNAGGDIKIDRTIASGLFHESGTFTNAGTLTLGAVADLGTEALYNNATFHNNSSGQIWIDRAYQGLSNYGGTFTNDGKMTIGALGLITTFGLVNDNSVGFNNGACAELTTFYAVYSTSPFNNAGLFTVHTTGTHTTNSALTNNGILSFPQGNAFSNVTNNDLIVKPFAGECVVSPAVSIGSMNSFTLGATWYKDANLTMPAGTFNQATNTFTATNLAEGNTHTLYFNVHDNVNNCDRKLSVGFRYFDVTPPVLTCPNSASVIPTDPASCTVLLSNLQASVNDNCTGYSLNYSISGASSGSSSGQLGNATFNSGLSTISYTAVDGSVAGNSATCQFTVNVAPCINGRLIWKQDNTTGVKDATVALSGDLTASTLSATNGSYGFVLASGSNFTITPSKNQNKLNGVNSLDINRFQQHLMGNVLTSPWQLAAADVNGDNVINSMDMSILQQAILGNPSVLSLMPKSWRFVPKTHNMATPPWGFPENISLSGVTGKVENVDFYGIKVGDLVSTYANPANATGQPLVLTAQDQTLAAGQTLSVDVTASALRDLTALQFALHFDPAYLQLSDIQPLMGLPLAKDNFGTYQATEGSVRLLWSEAQSAALASHAPLFRLRFAVLEGGRSLSEVLSLDDETLLGQVFNSDGAASGVSLRFEGVTAVQDPSLAQAQLLQNYPNPFLHQTTIGFVLPEACEAQLRIVDAGGRVVVERRKQYPAGRSAERFELELAPGVYHYQLSTLFGVQTKQMVVIEK